MAEFWEDNFKLKQSMWGSEAVDSAKDAAVLFHEKGLKKILIPGFGYGRNAQAFLENGFEISGIEISETAIALSKKYISKPLKIYHGPVSEMPFSKDIYDGIFCYSLIHLLNRQDRDQFIQNCYKQLKPRGLMIFVAISTNDNRFGIGEKLDKNYFSSPHGLNLFFYDKEDIEAEFREYGLKDYQEIQEPKIQKGHLPGQILWRIICEK